MAPTTTSPFAIPYASWGFYGPWCACPVNYVEPGNITPTNWNNADAFWVNGYTAPINSGPNCIAAMTTSALVDTNIGGDGWLNAQKAALDIANAQMYTDNNYWFA